MAIAIHWIQADVPKEPLDGNTIPQGKRVRGRIQGWEPGREPTQFHIWRYRGWVLDRVRGKPVTSLQPEAGLLTLGRESEAWPAGLSAFSRSNQSILYFEDEHKHRSPFLTVTNVSWGIHESKSSGTVGTSLSLPKFPVSGLIKFTEDRAQTEFVIDAISDPRLGIEILLPWEDAHDPFALTRFLSDEFEGEVSFPAPLNPEGWDVITEGFLSPQRPPGWRISLERKEVVLEEGGQEIVPIYIHAESPGRASFAVRVYDLDDPQKAVIGPVISCERKGFEHDEASSLTDQETRKKAIQNAGVMAGVSGRRTMAPPAQVELVIKTSSQVMSFNSLPKPQPPVITMNGNPIPSPQAPYYPTGYQLVTIDASKDYTDPASILSNRYIQLQPASGSNWWNSTYGYLYSAMIGQTLKWGNPNQQLFILASYGLDNNMCPTNDGIGLLFDYGGGPAVQNWATHCDPGSQTANPNSWVSIPASYILVGFSQHSFGQGDELYQPNATEATLTVTLHNNVPPS